VAKCGHLAREILQNAIPKLQTGAQRKAG
jgi:hypothetical protein